DLFWRRLLWRADRVARLLRKGRGEAKPIGVRDPGRLDPEPEPFFAIEKSGGRRGPARHGAGSSGRAEEDQPGAGAGSEAHQGRVASETDAAHSGKLRDGRGPARPEPAPHSRANR